MATETEWRSFFDASIKPEHYERTVAAMKEFVNRCQHEDRAVVLVSVSRSYAPFFTLETPADVQRVSVLCHRDRVGDDYTHCIITAILAHPAGCGTLIAL